MNIESEVISREELKALGGVLRRHPTDYRDFVKAIANGLKPKGRPPVFFDYIDAISATMVENSSRLYAVLKRVFPKLSGRSVLQVGGNHSLALHIMTELEGLEAVSLDINQRIVDECAPRCAANLMYGNAFDLPEEFTGSFDAMLMLNFLDFSYFVFPDFGLMGASSYRKGLERMEVLLTEAERVLVPGGALISSLTNVPEELILESPFERAVKYSDGFSNMGETYSLHKRG